MISLAGIVLLMFNVADTLNISEVRKLYYKAYENKVAADEFFKVMKGVDNASGPVLLGYQAMSYLMQAKFSYNPYTKLASFNKGKSLIDQAAGNAPQNLEIRFLRFSVQTNAPKFLGYNTHIEADKIVILKEWRNCTDIDLKKRIKDFMLKSSYCTDNERSVFE